MGRWSNLKRLQSGNTVAGWLRSEIGTMMVNKTHLPISRLFTPGLGLNLGPKRRVPAKCAIRHARTGQPMGWRIRTCARLTGFQCTRPQEKYLLGLHDLIRSHQNGWGEYARRWHRRSKLPFLISSMDSSSLSEFVRESSRQLFPATLHGKNFENFSNVPKPS
jgi:hypothetical protein